MSARGAIENTLYQYSLGYDEADMDLQADCFTADAVILSGEDDRIEGREVIKTFFTERRADRTRRSEQSRHVVTNVYIRNETEDEAVVVSYLTLLTTPNEGGAARTEKRVVDTEASFASGWYRDRFVRDGDKWRIRERQVHLDGLGFTRSPLA
jgi:ketosteroid isomerase-like protein